MFTVSHIFPCRGRKYSLLYNNISNVYCSAISRGKQYVPFYINVYYCAYIPFTVSHISPSRGKQYVHFYINMSNVYFFAYIPVMSGFFRLVVFFFFRLVGSNETVML